MVSIPSNALGSRSARLCPPGTSPWPANMTPPQADKLRTQQELERLQAKYVGTGHPDTTSWELRTNIGRDTFSSIAGHYPLLTLNAVAENEPITKTRHRMITVRTVPYSPHSLSFTPSQDLTPHTGHAAAMRTASSARRRHHRARRPSAPALILSTSNLHWEPVNPFDHTTASHHP